MKTIRAKSGFTLLEALLATAILAIAITAVTMPFSTAAANEQIEIRQTMALGLAQEMMEEILSRPFTDPGGPSSPGADAGEDPTDRTTFDNLDDYESLQELPGELTDMQGTPIDDQAAQQLSRHVTATYVYVDGQDLSLPPTFILLQVEVRYGQTNLVNLSRLRYQLGT